VVLKAEKLDPLITADMDHGCCAREEQPGGRAGAGREPSRGA